MLELRPYQSAAIASVLDYWGQGGGNPLVEMATGTGKSLVISELVRTLTQNDPDTRILMLVPLPLGYWPGNNVLPLP